METHDYLAYMEYSIVYYISVLDDKNSSAEYTH
jgi:hypothetical protein